MEKHSIPNTERVSLEVSYDSDGHSLKSTTPLPAIVSARVSEKCVAVRFLICDEEPMEWHVKDGDVFWWILRRETLVDMVYQSSDYTFRGRWTYGPVIEDGDEGEEGSATITIVP